MRIILVALVIGSVVTTAAADESFRELNDMADQRYGSGEFEAARKLLEQAREQKPGDPTVNYNLGSVYHQEGIYDQAGESYLNAYFAGDSVMQANTFYNIGNTEFRMGDYAKAVESYKKSLKLNPDDTDAKYNLEVAMRRLEEQQQQQQQCQNPQDQEKQEKQDKENQNQQQEQQQQQDQQQEQQQQQDQQQQPDERQQQQDERQQQQSSEDQEQQQQQQQTEQQQMEMSEEDAERLLNAARGNDREVLRKLVNRRIQASGYEGKDW